MEFVDNTGHIFSLPSYNEKPIGYEYEEYSYVFWIDSNNTSKLSVNNFYSKPIYALYELNKDFDIEDLEDDYNSVLDIEIYTNNSNIFKLISSRDLQKSISKEDFKLTDYVDLNMLNDTDEKYSFLKTRLTNEDLYCVKTTEVKTVQNDTDSVEINYLMIPIYPIACAKEAGTWITNLMIHIHNNSNNTDEWCYISVGGEFIDEYEELIINGRNMGISLPKDILKSVYAESLYNDEYNEALFNEKMKEYMLNYMNIKGNIGNFKSAIDSLKWFGYGDRISISKLLRTDNEFKQQYILDYFDISNDILESFKTFVATAFVSLMIMINKETDKQYPFNFHDDENNWDDLTYIQHGTNIGKSFFYGENRPKMLSLLDYYQKIKIGNHDMPIDNDDEKYWYWKPYFDFSFNELGVKLICLAYYYKKYFLPIHLNIHSTSLGYRVFANNLKLTNTLHIIENEPSIVLNDKNEVKFKGNGIHYFTKQIHYIDEYFNEFELGTNNIDEDIREWYYLNDTCVNIPIQFITNEFNKGYFNCVLLLQKSSNNETLYESHFNFYQCENKSYRNFIIYPKKLNIITRVEYKYIYVIYQDKYQENNLDHKKEPILIKKFIYETKEEADNNLKKLINDELKKKIKEFDYGRHINNESIKEFKLDENGHKIPQNTHYIKDDNGNILKDKYGRPMLNNDVQSKYFEYWINNDFAIKLLVNNKWYEYDFKLKIHNPTLDFGTLKYRYYFNDRNYLFSKITNNTDTSLHNIVFCGTNDTYKINNMYIDYNHSLFVLPTIFTGYVFNIPSNYICYNIDKSYISETDGYGNEIKLSWTLNWDNEDDQLYYIYEYNDDKLLDINNSTAYQGQPKYINIDNPIILVCPENWGTPLFIKNDLTKVNEYIYNIFNLNKDNNEWNQETWVQSFNLLEAEHIYQFFKENYNLLSPFKQIRGLDIEHNKVMFNAYMHNKQLVDMNEINFDVNFQTILKYHLDHNLLYMDGTLTDGEFYQYIIYTDTLGDKHEVYIHKDLIGYNISFFADYLNNNDKVLLCAYQDDIFILTETFDSSNNDNNYEIINASEIESEVLFKTEDTGEFLKYDTIDIKYDYLDNTYKEFDDNGNIIRTYEIYDKLYANSEKIYSRYSTLVNLPNNPKYKNSLHLFGIYQNIITENNILIFHNNIDMHIDGLRFTHGVTRDLNDNEQLKIYIQGILDSSIDTRFPDTYGLYWSQPESIAEGHKPVSPSQIIEIKDRLGFYVKRDARKCYDPIRGTTAMNIWDVPNLYEFDTKEFTYYIESKEICIGSITYKTLNDFYENRIFKKNLNNGYEDLNIYIKEISEEHIYCFDDKEICDLDDLTKPYANKLSYTIAFFDELDNRLDISLNKIDNENYDKVIVTFYYHKAHIIRNRFYTLSDYLNYLNENNIENISNISTKDNKYYLNIKINNSTYIIELIRYDDKFMYQDNSYKHLISVQNPSMYWYNADKLSLESFPSYLNNIERYVYGENDSYETIKANLDNYINNFKGNRYAQDEDIARYKFKNYLVKDLTGISGKYRMEFISNISDYATMHVEVIDETGNIINYTEIGTEFEFTGNEKKITVFISINSNKNINWKDRTDIYIIPKLIKIVSKEQRLSYKAEDYGKEIIPVKYLNKEFKYGDNDNINIFNLYNDFFKLKFNVYDTYFDNKELKSTLLHSVYEYDDEIKLDTYLNYDFYLMHDDNYWYGLYISQETCDKIRTNEDLKLRNEADKKKILKNKYILNYEKSSEEYLLNRLEFNTSEGFNQFKTDDIVCCYLHNNDRLPFNASISSKWKIHPMSLGMSTDTSFDSNGEMTIISLPMNDAKYERGYYQVTVKYSLDRDIQHQFKNTSIIRIS